jgi:tRNA-Thr(GGU) m(6)t(6)A37 methyltransferase TsaA
MPAAFTIEPIAVARTPYGERFGAPNQAATVRGTRNGEAATGRIELLPHVPDGTLEGLSGFDYAWVIFVFHLNQGWGPKVRPPRAPHLSLGVLATRAPHRPSRLGLSALAIESVQARALVVRGIDLVDGTPVLDIKPYVPYADAFPAARAGWLDDVAEAPDEERGRRDEWDEA